MPTQALKQGSKGKFVGLLQKNLNHPKVKLPKPLLEDEIFGPITKEAVKFFQKRNGLDIDGIAGPDTGAALQTLIGQPAAALAKALGEPDDDAEGGGAGEKDKAKAGEEKTEETYNLTYGGKVYALTKAEYVELNKDMLSTLKKTAVLGAAVRVNSARTLWDSFDELNKDQYIVSWFVSLAGPKLPDEGKIKAAEQALKRLEDAVSSGDCKKVIGAFQNASDPINEAYTAMMTYQKGVIDRSGTWLKGLEFTRDKAFDIVETIATAELGGTPASGAIAGGGGELVKSAAGELGKYLAGTSGGGAAAAKNIAVDVAVGALSGGVSAFMKLKGDKVLEGVAESCAKKVSGSLFGIGKDKIQAFLAKRLEGAAKGALEGAIKNAAKAIKGNMTPSQFFEEVGKEMAFGSFMNGIESWIGGKDFGKTVYAKMPSALKSKLFSKLAEKDAIEKLNEVIKSKGSAGVKKALEIALDKATGNEKAEDLGEKAAIEFANSGVKALEAEIAKAVKDK